MGFADALLLLGLRYDSQEAVAFAEKLASFIQEEARKASEEFAKERGCFPNWKGSVWDTKYHRPMRNAAVTTIAPRGGRAEVALSGNPWSYREVESQPRTGEGMMAVCKRRIRLADEETQDQGMSKTWQNAGFPARLADFDDKNGRADT